MTFKRKKDHRPDGLPKSRKLDESGNWFLYCTEINGNQWLHGVEGKKSKPYSNFQQPFTFTFTVIELKCANKQYKWWYWLWNVMFYSASNFCTSCTILYTLFRIYAKKNDMNNNIPSTLIFKKNIFLFPSLILLSAQNQIHITVTQISPVQSLPHCCGCLHCCFSTALHTSIRSRVN